MQIFGYYDNSLVGKHEYKWPVHENRPSWETCIEIEIENILRREVDWARLAQDKVSYWIYVRIVHGLRGATNDGEFLEWLSRCRLLQKLSGFEVRP